MSTTDTELHDPFADLIEATQREAAEERMTHALFERERRQEVERKLAERRDEVRDLLRRASVALNCAAARSQKFTDLLTKTPRPSTLSYPSNRANLPPPPQAILMLWESNLSESSTGSIDVVQYEDGSFRIGIFTKNSANGPWCECSFEDFAGIPEKFDSVLRSFGEETGLVKAVAKAMYPYLH